MTPYIYNKKYNVSKSVSQLNLVWAKIHISHLGISSNHKFLKIIIHNMWNEIVKVTFQRDISCYWVYLGWDIYSR